MEEQNKQNETQQKETEAGAPVEAEPQPSSEKTTVDDATAKKVIYSLCYLWGILFFLPLLLYKGDSAATRHANEGLVLLLFSVVGNVVFGILSSFGGFIGTLFGIVAGVYSLLLLILGIIGIVYVVTDNDQPLPILGCIRIFK